MLHRPPYCSLRTLLLLGLLLLGTAPRTQAQVVIKERVEIGTPGPKTLLSPQERARFFGLHTAGKTAAANTIVIPKDGTLRIVYGAAERLGVPYLRPSAELLITHNGVPAKNLALVSTFQSAVDTVFAHPWQSDLIFPVFCFGSSIDRYGYGTDTQVDTFYTATAEAIVLEVEQGDELSFLFETTDFGQVYGDDPGEGAVFLDESTPPGVVRWLGGLGRYEASCPWATDLLLFDIEYAVTLAFLRQDDIEIPTEDKAPDEAVLMVSKFRTDKDLGASVVFNSPFTGANADEDTFRPQVTGIDSGEDVKFRVQIFRNGQPAGYNEIFDSVSGTLPNGDLAYRGDQHLRLVSNAKPPSAPSGARYDDDYRGRQTIRVELEDIVRVTLVLGGMDTDTQAELPVGRPASEDGPNAVRRAEVNFRTRQGLSSAPATTIDRMSEDWAQAAVYFKDVTDPNALTYDFVRNVLRLRLRGNTAPADGTLSVDIELQDGSMASVSADYNAGQNVFLIAGRLLAAIQQAGLPGIDVFNTFVSRFRPPGQNVDEVLVLVDKGRDVRFRNIGDSRDVRLDAPRLRYGRIRALEMNVIGLNFKDNDDSTIDLFVVPDRSLADPDPSRRRIGNAISDNARVGAPGLWNSMYLVEIAVDQSDRDAPFAAGHEIGHILTDQNFPGGHPIDPRTGQSDPSHSNDPENLMWPDNVAVEDWDAPKRLTLDQSTDVRSDSGPGSTPPELLKKLSKSQ